MLAAASFNGRKQESYFVARDILGQYIYLLPKIHILIFYYPEPPSEIVRAIFPWIEDEQASLKERRASIGKSATDSTLANFLELLARMRRIILQDAAVLMSKYPDCPLFKFAPFDHPQFLAFASSSIPILEHAEQDSRHQLSKIPENMATSLQGIITTNNIQHAQAQRDMLQQNIELTTQVESIGALLHTVLLGSQSKRRKAASSLPTHPTPSPLVLAPPLVPSPSPHPSRSCTPAAPSFEQSLSPDPTAQIQSISDNFPAPILSSNSTVSPNGYPASTFKLSTISFDRSKQLNAITVLETKFSVDRLCHHHFEWSRSSSKSKEDEWLPVYVYWMPKGQGSPSIEEIWTEWSFGMGGCLSVRELSAEWEARWRRNNGQMKTEASRRKKIIDLIETLSKKTNWNYTIALRFLKDNYPIPTRDVPYLRTTQAFIDFLQKKEGGAHDKIYSKADTYLK